MHGVTNDVISSNICQPKAIKTYITVHQMTRLNWFLFMHKLTSLQGETMFISSTIRFGSINLRLQVDLFSINWRYKRSDTLFVRTSLTTIFYIVKGDFVTEFKMSGARQSKKIFSWFCMEHNGERRMYLRLNELTWFRYYVSLSKRPHHVFI